MKITVCNTRAGRILAPDPAVGVAQIPWTWEPGSVKPALRAAENGAIAIDPEQMCATRLYFDGNAEALFTENESNGRRLWNNGTAGFLQGCFPRSHSSMSKKVR